jgi:excinuclease UvrABC nuclease subunit
VYSPDATRLELPGGGEALDAVLATLPASAAVFLLELPQGQQPYLGRCGNLRRRLIRLLRAPAPQTRLLNLRGIARNLVYWRCGSALEASLTLLEQARSHFPDRYLRLLRLRYPYFVRFLIENRFPRLAVSSQPGDPSTAFGPFLCRAQAEDFASRTLDFFLIRRCDEDLVPHPSHPGCIYGEMMLCLRPCQQAVSEARYQAEARELLACLRTEGASLRSLLEQQRQAASEALDFEQAARFHKRLGKWEECWRGMGEFSSLLSALDGVALTRGDRDREITLWPVAAGSLGAPQRLLLASLSSQDLTARISAALAAPPRRFDETDREHLAVLTKWKHSSWCDGEWVRIRDREKIPSRKILNAAKRLLPAQTAEVAEGTVAREQLTESQHAAEATQLSDHDR